MDIKLYSFKKKYNSTKRPSDSGRTFDCTLVENTSLLSPSVRLKAPSDLIGKVKEPVTPGSLITISDNNALLDEPLPVLQAGVLYDGTAKNSLTLFKSGKNLCGGSQLLENAQAYIPSGTADTTNNYFSYAASASPASGTGGFTGSLSNKFKANTAYTLILTFSKSSGRDSNMAVRYTDNTIEVIPQLPSDFVQYEKYTIIFTTNSSKTLDFMQKRNGSGATRLYYNECGVFEGTLTADQFEAYNAEKITVNFPEPIYGGYYNADTGILSVTKDSDGEDLPTPYPMYQCTPHDIYLNADVTNIWCNTGAIESCYYWKYQTGAGRMYQYNYAFIPDMDRYYWIKDIRYELGTWVFDLSIDVLASWKNTIGSSSHYIERCSYTHDGTIVDTMYPEKADPDLVIIEPDKVSNVTPTIFGNTISPSFIVGIIGGIAPENAAVIGNCYNGSVTYFSLEQDQLGDFITYLLDSVTLYDIPTGELSEQLQKQLINPIQYIHSIKCVPFTPNVSQEYVAKGFLLGFTYGEVPHAFDPDESKRRSWKICKAPTIGDITKDNGYMEKRYTMVKLPLHPEYTTRGKWVLGTPISKYVFDVQPFGQIEIPSGEILSAPITVPLEGDPYIQMEVTTVFDISTGDCTLFLNWGGTSKPEEAFVKVTKNCAIPVPVHQSVQDAMGFRQDMRELDFQILSTPSSFVGFTRDVLGSIGTGLVNAAAETRNIVNKMMNTVDSATKANQVAISGNGNEGSYMSFNKDLTVPRVRCYFSPLAEEHNEERGRPLCQVKRINEIPGYIVTSGADFASAGTMDENTQIVQLMNGGFFYE